ncbi:response regulator [Polaromonas sp.]|uniref:response regulator n=1 Tax=Polaromonas sp. TaxID=1869339 RepID=UPI0037533CE6
MRVKDKDHSSHGGHRALKVFLVEDNVVLRNIIVDALRDIASIEVLFYADNEVAATNWLSSNDSAWDLAVVDLHLKKGSGVGALSWCTTRRPGQRVVVLSGELTDDLRQKCLALRADAVFDKGTEMDDFLSYCKSLAG